MSDVQFNVGGLTITIKPMAWIGSVAIWLVLTAAAVLLMQLDLGSALLAGLLGTILHWVGETVHQMGHAIFARQTGYPMTGISYGSFGGVLATSIYPADEPPLPDFIHLQRALGGPFLSLQLALIAGLLVLAQAEGARGALWFASIFFALENLFVYTLQAAVPLGFNDGEVIWRVLRNRQK